MKKLIVLLFIIIFNSCCSKKESFIQEKETYNKRNVQTLKDFKGDTLIYVKTKILDRKEYYIGKKFEVLLNDLNIPVKSVLYISDFNNMKTVSDAIFEIYNEFQIANKLEKGEIPVNIVIVWQTPLNASELDNLSKSRTERSNWSPEKEAYFKEQIIGGLTMTNYNLEKYKKK